MRLIDAAIKDLEMIGDCRTCGNKDPFCEDNPDSCIGYKWRGSPIKDKPLTLEELLKMDGEPVWLTFPGRDIGLWALVLVWSIAKNKVFLISHQGGASDLDHLLNNGVKIYRRRPEEVTK